MAARALARHLLRAAGVRELAEISWLMAVGAQVVLVVAFMHRLVVAAPDQSRPHSAADQAS